MSLKERYSLSARGFFGIAKIFEALWVTLVLICGFFWIPISSASGIQDGLVWYWSFDSCVASDNSAYGDNGYVVWDPKCVDGIKSKALRFDWVYSPDYVVIPNASQISSVDNFTFSLWFNIQGNTAMDGWWMPNDYGKQVILAKSWDREGLEIGLGRSYQDGLWYPNIFNGRCCTADGRWMNVPDGHWVSLGTWHMVSVTVDADRIRLYLDGNLEAEQPTSYFNINPAMMFSNLQLSIWEWSYWYPFNGMVDEVRVYNRALNQDEISDVMADAVWRKLSVVSSDPQTYASQIPVTKPLTFNFSVPLDPEKIAGNVLVTTQTTSEGVNTSLSGDGKTLALTPMNGLWDTGANYTVKLLSSLAGTDGSTLGSDQTIIFTTESGPGTPDAMNSVASTANPSCPYGYVLNDPICGSLNYSAAATNEAVTLASATSQQDQGDPVTLSSGEFAYHNTFLTLPGSKLPYELSLSYRSQAYSNGTVGVNWDHNYDIFLRENADGSVSYFDGKLGTYTFTKSSDGSFDWLPGIEATLSKAPDGMYSIMFKDGSRYAFGANLHISKISDRNDNALSFAYDSDNRLSKVTDSLGREAAYVYNDTGRLSSVTAPNGKKVDFAYYSDSDTDGSLYDLKSVVISSGDGSKTVSFTYSKDAVHPALAHNLVKLLDSKEQIYVSNAYDENDRVVSQTYGNGTIAYSYSMDPSGKFVQKNVATNRKGAKTTYIFDERGNILEKTVAADHPVATKYAYDSNGRVISETKPLGNGTTYSYDDRGNVVSKREKADMSKPDSDADLVTGYSYEPNFNNPERVTDPNGTVMEFVSDNHGNITKATTKSVHADAANASDLVTGFEYDAHGNLVKETDPAGRVKSYEYSGSLPTKITVGTGDEASVTTYSYDANGNPLTVTDPEGNKKTFTYDAFDQLKASLTAAGIARSFEYDANGNRTKESLDLSGGNKLTRTASFDVLDQQIGDSVGTDATDARTASTTYDANGNPIETVDARGTKTTYSYDEFERLAQKAIVSGSSDVVTKYAYGDNGNLIRVTDPNGNVTKFAYDGFDRLVSSTDALGTVTSYARDKNGNVIAKTVSDAAGNIVSKIEFTVNELGKALVQKSVDAATGASKSVVTAYDASGNAISVTDPKGSVTKSLYDSQNRLVGTLDPLGNSTVFSYDRRGLVKKKQIVDANGKVRTSVSYGYDKDGRKTSETDALGNSKKFFYDSLNRVIQAIDEVGNKTDYAYDAFGNLLSETKYDSAGKQVVTKYAYDKGNNRISLTDANGNITKYEYDALGRLTKETKADGSATTYAYDPNGNVVSSTDANGTKTTNSYDALGRLTDRSYVLGAGVQGVTHESFVYDPLGRLVSSSDDQGNQLAFAYDALGNLVSETENGKAVAYSYDSSGNVTDMTYPSGKKLAKAYDADNRLVSIGMGDKQVAGYEYDPLMLSKLSYGNWTQTAYSYDPLVRLKELANPQQKQSISYDTIGNIIGDGANAYAYDPLSRLAKASYPADQSKKSRSEAWTYDPMGNRTASSDATVQNVGKNPKADASSTAYSANILNQYTTAGTANLAYDRNGNLVSNGTFTFVYDAHNRLVEAKFAKDGSTVGKYAYDPLGRRISKETKDVVIKYAYSGENAVEETVYVKKDGKLVLSETRENVYGKGIDDIIAVVRTAYQDGTATATYFFQKNHEGSVVAIADASGKTVDQYRYDAFGKAYVRDGKSDNFRELKESKIGNSRLFTGREYDAETWTYYYRARTYDTSLGRFLQKDPIGTVDQINLYTYVGNNPARYVDPRGMEKEIVWALAIYSNRWGSDSVPLADGHSWIEITVNNSTIKYGLWPDRGWADEPNWWYWKEIFDWIQINWPESAYDAQTYILTPHATMDLTQSQLNVLRSYIQGQIESGREWSILNPCSSFAADAWNSISPNLLADRNVAWISNPNTLADSIESINQH